MPEQVRHLHGCRTAREHQQAAAGGMAGEIHQDVDAVAPDHVGDRRIVQPDDIAPVAGQRAEALGDGIGRGHRGVAEQLDACRVMRRQQWFGEPRDCVLTEVG